MVNGQKIRLLREEAQLSAQELGAKVGANQSMITQIEKGYKQPSVALLKRIADYFGTAIDELIVEDAV